MAVSRIAVTSPAWMTCDRDARVRADDYRWVARSFPDFAVAHCVTVIVGGSPDQVLVRMCANDALELAGLTAVEGEPRICGRPATGSSCWWLRWRWTAQR
jgi:hypothetical protein